VKSLCEKWTSHAVEALIEQERWDAAHCKRQRVVQSDWKKLFAREMAMVSGERRAPGAR
jgi:hypothetical protein